MDRSAYFLDIIFRRLSFNNIRISGVKSSARRRQEDQELARGRESDLWEPHHMRLFETVRLPNEVVMQPILVKYYYVKSIADIMTDATDLLATLKTEKAALHEILQSYERDFYNEHNRQVSSLSDTQQMFSLYRRYKDIKKAIRRLELEEEIRLAISSE